MNSRDALNILYIATFNGQDEYDTISKDLDVLDTLKELIKDGTIVIDEQTLNDYGIIKRWLER